MTHALAVGPELAAALTHWRHHLHAHPELSRQECRTAAYVAARLAEIGVPFVAGVGGHGLVATIRRGHSSQGGPTQAGSNRSVGLRADMDALPIAEDTGAAYASVVPGVMHACGHDGHIASLLGAAALLQRSTDWAGTVHLVFQPAEEGYGGARAMLADGLLQRFPMERLFGYHNWPGLAAGEMAVHAGAVMAQGSRLTVTMQGHPGHAAMPHLTRDPVLALAHAIVAIQSVVSRNVDPADSAVVSFGMLEAGAAANQIPSRAAMRGTVRSHRPKTHALVEDAIRRVVAGTAATFGVTGAVDIHTGVSPVINAPAEAALAAETAARLGLPVHRSLPPSMASEDFGAYLEQIPGAFVWIGNGPADDGRELHHPRYDFNDAILPAAALYLASVAKAALA